MQNFEDIPNHIGMQNNQIGMQLCMTTKLTYLITAYYTPNDGFTANLSYCYESKVGQLHYTLLSCELIVYTNTKITKRYCRIFLFMSLLPSRQNRYIN